MKSRQCPHGMGCVQINKRQIESCLFHFIFVFSLFHIHIYIYEVEGMKSFLWGEILTLSHLGG